MAGARPIRILTAHSQPQLRVGMAASIRAQPDMRLVAEAGDAQSAIGNYRAHRPDVALIDLRLTVLSGLEAIAAIRAEFPGARIIVLASHEDGEKLLRALQAGARGFVLKDQLSRELIDAIRLVAKGGRYLPAPVSRIARPHAMRTISPGESDELRLLTRGLNDGEIAHQLPLSDDSVPVHLIGISDEPGGDDRL